MILVPNWLAALYIGFNVGCVFTMVSREWHAEQRWRITWQDIFAAALTILVPLPLLNLAAILVKRWQARKRALITEVRHA